MRRRRLLSWQNALALACGAALGGTAPQASAQEVCSAPVNALDAQAAAQPSGTAPLASLVADSLYIERDNRLVAQGHVEVLYQGSRLSASRLVYDRKADRMTIEGPILLTEGGGSILLADSADLSGNLRDGILRSARLVLDQQLQLAATEIIRVGGRYTALNRTVASSCSVSAAHPVPLWEIRAARVIHDQQARQLYFDRATLRIAGVPIAYVPRLRIPDPTLKRASGFLLPTFRNTSLLGAGIKLPYFFAIGDSRDLTLTPYLSTGHSTTLNLRYRQAYRTGRVEVNGALSRDRLRPGALRGYLFANGDFALPNDFKLSFQVQSASDPAYLLDYGISSQDRLRSQIEISRTRRDAYVSGRLIAFHSIRAGESNATLPWLLGDFTWVRRFRPALIGGEGGLTFQTHSHLRNATDLQAGRHVEDAARASIGLDWRRNWTLPGGLLLAAIGHARADIYALHNSVDGRATISRAVPALGVEIRWPWTRTEPTGAAQVIEPVIQLIWSPRTVTTVPNEDSTLVEFDEGNLWSLDRFAGADAVERGPRANVGLSWTRYDPSGWSLGVTAGRIFRSEALQPYSPGSGLGGGHSDWLAAVRLSSGNLSLTNRGIFDDNLKLTKDELRLAWTGKTLNLATSFIQMTADPSENRPTPTSEWAMDAGVALNDRWSGKLSWRYDFEAERATSAGLALRWRTECISVDLSLSRRFTSSTSVAATTDFGLSVDLIGIGGQGAGGAPRRRMCSG